MRFTAFASPRLPRPVARFLAAAVIGLGFVAPLAGPDAAMARSAPVSFADLAEQLSPAVVNISTAQTIAATGRRRPVLPEGSPLEEFFKEFFNERGGQNAPPRRVNSLGSGFVVDPEGYVVTNNHVIDGADEIEVNFADGSSLPATLVGRDAKTDIALLKIEPEAPLAFVSFGDSNTARVGDWVLAIGNPFGLGGSVSAGIISARNRDINSGPYDDYIQTDAAINKGNSGGPLFNMDGQVIGVNTAIISPSGGSIGIGFSVPAEIVRNVVAQLREFGETRRGWLGVRIQNVDPDIAESLGLDSARGALVAGVDESGPAFAAGVEPGDVIISFDGRDIDQMKDLPRIVADTPVGETVPVVIFRDGAFETISVTVALLDEQTLAARSGDEDPSAEMAPESIIGLTLAELTAETRERYDIAADVEGVLITEVDPASSAYEKNLRSGDVLVEVAQESVTTPEEARARIETVRDAGDRRSVLLMVRRGEDIRFVAVEFNN